MCVPPIMADALIFAYEIRKDLHVNVRLVLRWPMAVRHNVIDYHRFDSSPFASFIFADG